jgi:hypothetical protein
MGPHILFAVMAAAWVSAGLFIKGPFKLGTSKTVFPHPILVRIFMILVGLGIVWAEFSK